MKRCWHLLVLGLVLLLPYGQAQGTEAPQPLYEFRLVVEDTDPIFVGFGQRADIEVTFIDDSRDSTAGAADGVPPLYGFFHSVDFDTSISPDDDERGWVVRPPSPVTTQGGTQTTSVMQVLAGNQIVDNTITVDLNATITTQDGQFFRNVSFQFFTDGLRGFSVRPVQSVDTISPSELAQASIALTNPSLFPETYHMEVRDNPCGLQVGAPASVTLAAKESNREVFFSVAGPEEQLWYFTEDCSFTIAAYPASAPEQAKTVPIGVVVNGGYLDPELVFTILAIAVAVILLAFFLVRRKAAIEEELLGKPQRPWTIPVERVYLEHLQERDPRAAYVVRHFLMEEEYQSSLLWYRSYKHATKGTRSKERLVVGQEKKYQRFQDRWQKKIARPQKKADRFEAKLQKKLDRQGKKGVRKQRRKWKKQVAKLEKAFDARHEKQLKKWEKQAKKAEKKGLDAPEKPERGTPDLPPEPSLERIMLADHQWNKKAQRFRRKMVKKEGNLEVKFEKKDARMLRKVEKKVHRIARKMDDPEFAAEHPLVGKQAD